MSKRVIPGALRLSLPIVLLACAVLLAACDMTPPAVSATMRQITQACQARDKQALKALYARESAADDESIEQALGSWDAYFDGQWAYSGISYRTVASMASDPQYQMIASSIQTQKLGGILMGPNLPVVGFITVSFKIGSQPAAAIEPIGIAPDGSAKIVIVRRQ
jgi:hypothetical protein